MLSIILSLLVNANVPNPTQTAQLILTTAESAKIDPVLLAKIVIVESRGKPDAINRATGDYGIVQIHLDAHPDVTAECALDIECGLRAGAKIIKGLNRPCSFNLGNGGARKFPKACQQYEEKLASIN